ncbi:MAG: hypothetical protein J0I28_04035, partial [Caulobacterales bacterium]|nr:hypothetical protein [Caulobacterales bacterium]
DNRQIAPGFVWRTNLAAQLNGNRLPGTEQMAAGGDEFVRGFETATNSGDSGDAASGELAWRPSKGLPPRLLGSEAYGFVDGARLHYQARYGLPDRDPHLASVGGGVRVRTGKRSVAQIEAVRGLNNPVAYANREVWRLNFSLRSVVF